VHFLLNDGTLKNRQTLPAVIKAVKNNQDPIAALEMASGQSLKQIEGNWHQYISRL
jgi:hypothetical protein